MAVELSQRQAKQEAKRVSRLSPDELRKLFDERQADRLVRQPLESELLVTHARQQKPQLYGRLGIFVGQTLMQTFEGRTYNGVPKLLHMDTYGQTREATNKERSTWDGLRTCWSDTLFATMLRIIQSANTTQMPELIALESLSLIRQRAGGSARDFYTKLRTDTENGAAQSLRIGLGMGKYQRRVTRTSYADAGNIAVIASSPQPVFSVAGLSMEQLGAFAVDFLGRREGDGGKFGTYGIHPKIIADHIYNTNQATGRIELDGSIEDFPIGNDELYVADIPMQTPGPPIGCPVMFDPALAALFFQATTNSAGEAMLI